MGDEWSLVLFTLLAQTSVGMIAVSQFTPEVETRTGLLVLRWAIGIMAASLLVSLTHLGDPFGAYRALYHVGSSWLSREIWCASGFFGLSLLLYWQVHKGARLQSLLGKAAAVLGVLMLISMSFIYVETSVYAWSTAYTHVTFFGAAAALGALAYSAVIIRVQSDTPVALYSRAFAAGAVGAGLQLLSLAPYLAALAAGSASMQATAGLLHRHIWLLAASQLLLLAGAIGFTFMAWDKYTVKGSGAAAKWLYLGLAAVITGELASRYLFYATGVHTMLGH